MKKEEEEEGEEGQKKDNFKKSRTVSRNKVFNDEWKCFDNLSKVSQCWMLDRYTIFAVGLSQFK